jgi:membrane dipeptidase
MVAQQRLLIDSHLDLAWNALSFNRDQTETVEQINQREAVMTDHNARGRATTSLPELRKAGVAIALGTILVRAKRHIQPATGHMRTNLDHGTQSIAYAVGQGQLAYYKLLESQGEMKMIGTVRELDDHWRRWQAGPHDRLPIGNILAMEGADPII